MANKKDEKKIELDIPALTQQQNRKMPEYKKKISWQYLINLSLKVNSKKK